MQGAAMTAQNASMGWVFDVAGLHRQGARCTQRREGLVSGVPPPPLCHGPSPQKQDSATAIIGKAPKRCPRARTPNLRALYRGFTALGLTADKRQLLNFTLRLIIL